MKATRQQVYAALDGERDYQDAKGAANHGVAPSKALEQYLYYMEYYLRLLNTQITTFWGPTANEDSGALESLRKLTALGVAAMEDHGAPMRNATPAQIASNRPSDMSPAPLGDEDGPGEEDGPWAEGWAERSGNAAKFSLEDIRTALMRAFPTRPTVQDLVIAELEKLPNA